MSISVGLKPINQQRTRTSFPFRTVDVRSCDRGAVLLFALASAATLSIWSIDPFPERIYEGGVFLLAGWFALRRNLQLGLRPFTWAVVACWGFAQLAAGATVYRDATLNGSLRVSALAATALVSSAVFRQPPGRGRLLPWFLPGFACFGCLLSVLSVIAYFASPGKILWLFPSPYPDVWGPFLSRNNFAQFLELAFPVALWLACSERRETYSWMSAGMLACGLASASRAGAVLLVIETLAVFLLVRPRPARRLVMGVVAGALAFATLAGGQTLLHRFQDSDFLRDRREIFASSLAMIAERPWAGYGLGTFATVYPEFARFDPGSVVEHAHSDWLEWAVEGGGPYATAWLLLAVALLRPALRSVWGIGVLAVFLHALVDHPFARIGVAAWVFILAGVLENTGVKVALTKRRAE